MGKKGRIILSSAFTIAVWLFWWLRYPQALGLQEQNQLFLFTWDYLGDRLSVMGGLSDWLAEFITQFNFIPCIGALLLAGLLTGLQVLVWEAAGSGNGDWYPLSFIPSAAMLACMGDHDVLTSFPVSLALALLLYVIWRRRQSAALALIAIPAAYWLIGPAVFIFVILAGIFSKDKKAWLLVPYAIFCLVCIKLMFIRQYPWHNACCGINWFRMPLHEPWTMVLTFTLTIAMPVAISLLDGTTAKKVAIAVQTAAITVCCALGVMLSFDKGTYELIAYDQLVRQERWEEIIKRAEKYQPQAEIGCVSINLALCMTGRMNEMQRFWQAGPRGLLMPRVRDYISNSSTCEAFWRLGFVNESLRYAFDTNESLINFRKSGRWMSRIAECQMVNGRYEVASKYLDILSHSLFYRSWALERKAMLEHPEKIDLDPMYGKLRKLRIKDDFLFYYPEMDKMLYRLWAASGSNDMAAAYFNAWTSFVPRKGGEE